MARHLVIPDPHAKPGTSNKRAEYAGRLICDLKPDVVVVLGDTSDFPSLCSYDKGKKSFMGRTYRADIESHSDFQDRMWSVVKASKKKLPLRVTLIGNHEQRITRAIDLQPELEGTIGYADLELDTWYDYVVPYEGTTPGTIAIDGITYAHYLVSGVAGRPCSGEHHAHSLLSRHHASCVVGHNHTLDYCIRTTVGGRRIQALCAGVYQDYPSGWAGEAEKFWWRGVCVLDNVEQGQFDLRTISLSALSKEYGRKN